LKSGNLKQGICAVLVMMVFSCDQKSSDPLANLSDRYCDCLKSFDKIPAEAQTDSCDQKVLADTLAGFPNDSLADVFLNDIHIQLQNKCKVYKRILDSLHPDEDWKKADIHLKSGLSATECNDITKYKKLFYIEPQMDTTFVTIENGVWRETMKRRKTFSELAFEWKDDCDFSLSFLRSNDEIKGKASKKGDKYQYRILEKRPDYFLVLGIIKKNGLQFRLYY
jgi:hypothetical protein